MREKDYLMKKINSWIKRTLKSENAERLRFCENLPEEFCRKGDSREPSAYDYSESIDGKCGVAGVEVCHYYWEPDGYWDDGDPKFRECTYSRFFPFAEETRQLRGLQDEAWKMRLKELKEKNDRYAAALIAAEKERGETA